MIRIALLAAAGGVLALAVSPVVGSLVEKEPIRWTNAPFPTSDPVHSGEPLSTTVGRCNDTAGVIVTTVARRLVNETTGETLSLTPGAGIVDPGCSVQTGGIGLPTGVSPGRYHVEQIVSVSGRWRTFQIPLKTQSFHVVEP